MRWTLLGIAVSAFISLWGMVHGYTLFAVFALLSLNFATFCVLHDRPMHRARFRVQEHARRHHPHADLNLGPASEGITLTAADRRLGFGPVTILNLATGVVAAAALIWGIVLRLT